MTERRSEPGARAFREELFADYLAFERGLAARTIEAYSRDIARLVAYLTGRGVVRPGEVTRLELRDYVYSLKDRGLAPTSIRRALSSARAYFAFLLEEEVIEADPTEQIESPRVWRTLPGVLSVREMQRLVESPDLSDRLCWRNRAILELLYATGMRVSELVGLRLQSLDIEDRVCLVYGKGSKERMVPFGAAAERALVRYLRDVRPRLERGRGEGIVFLSARGQAAHAHGGVDRRGQGARPGRDRKARLSAHASPQLRDPSAGGRSRSGGGPGTARACRHRHDRDLHARRPGICA